MTTLGGFVFSSYDWDLFDRLSPFLFPWSYSFFRAYIHWHWRGLFSMALRLGIGILIQIDRDPLAQSCKGMGWSIDHYEYY